MGRLGTGTIAALALLFAAGTASASERHFTFTQESATLAAGTAELEPQVTVRAGRDEYYRRFDNRIEFEAGILDNLQTALYLNFTGTGAGSGDARAAEFEYEGVSSEWKLKLMDPVADALGLALYLEATLAPLETAVEGKLIFDKRVGNLLFSLNLVAEPEWELEGDELEDELELEVDLAAAHFLTEHLSAGLELRNKSVLPGGTELENSALYAGPVVAYSTSGWWVAASVLPQVAALKGASPDSSLELIHDNERVNARVILGLHL